MRWGEVASSGIIRDLGALRQISKQSAPYLRALSRFTTFFPLLLFVTLSIAPFSPLHHYLDFVHPAHPTATPLAASPGYTGAPWYFTCPEFLISPSPFVSNAAITDAPTKAQTKPSDGITVIINSTNNTRRNLRFRPSATFKKLEEASTHKSAKTHAGNVFLWLVTLTFNFLIPK